MEFWKFWEIILHWTFNLLKLIEKFWEKILVNRKADWILSSLVIKVTCSIEFGKEWFLVTRTIKPSSTDHMSHDENMGSTK